MNDESKLIRSPSEIPAEDYYVSGHRTCAGCGPALGYRLVLKAAGPKTIVLGPTGCMYVANGHQFLSSPYAVPWYHTQLGAGGAAGIGTAAALRALMFKGKRTREDVNVVVYGGDGGMSDIGLSGLSMGLTYDYPHLLYLIYDNESYANTGVQASSTTPFGASTTFTPSGKVKPIGNERLKKDMALIAAAHPSIGYVATACISDPVDLVNKVRKALSSDRPSLVQLLAPCPKGWAFPPEETVEIGRMAINTGMWALWEYEKGRFRITSRPKTRKNIREYVTKQGRFSHLWKNEAALEYMQLSVDEQWSYWEEMDKIGKIILPWTAPYNRE
jgi:pyruvate ferredoxin oxidoreductase beta subunit/oxalate oxidoreductase subunit beta